jgi:hypothetical protein
VITTAIVVSGGLTVVAFVAALWLAWETRQLAKGGEVITTFSRGIVERFPFQAHAAINIFLFIAGLLTAHIWWDSACG